MLADSEERLTGPASADRQDYLRYCSLCCCDFDELYALLRACAQFNRLPRHEQDCRCEAAREVAGYCDDLAMHVATQKQLS